MIHEIDLLNELRSVPLGSAKLEWLKDHKEDQGLKAVLKFLFDGNVVTGVSKQKLAKEVPASPGINDLSELMDYFKAHKSGRDSDLAKLQGYLETIDPSDREDIKKLVSKDWNDLGIGEPTLEKVYGKSFLPQFGVQLAAKYSDNPGYFDDKEFTVTLKLDGLRAVLVKRDDDVSLWARSGKPINGYEAVMKEIAEAPGSFVIDGELLPRGWQGMSNKDQYKAALSGKSGRVEDKSTMVLAAFDYLEISEWDNKVGVVPYKERRAKLEKLVGRFGLIDVVPVLYSGTDTNEITKQHAKAKAEDFEGVMINENNAVYSFSRSRSLQKVKVFFEIDLPIIGFEKGTGRLSNTLGKLLLAYKGNTVRCGTGFSDEARDHIWKNRDFYLGKIVEITSFEESSNAGGGTSLRFPVFKSVKMWER
jgi:DNA ligase-1